MREPHPKLFLLIIPFLFLIFGVATLQHYGVTIDERETFDAARAYLRLVPDLLMGNTPSRWPFHEIRGYYFVLDSFRAVVALGYSNVGLGSFAQGFHFANLLLSAVSLWLLGWLCLQVSSRLSVSVFSQAALALFPQFIAHSQNNPKDLIGLFAFTLAVAVLLHFLHKGSGLSAAAAGLALGLAVTTSTLGFLSVFVVAVYRFTRPWYYPRISAPSWGVFLLVSMGTAFLFWPWLWEDPIFRLFGTVQRILRFRFTTQELHLGQLYPSTNMPWHYFLVNFLASTPIVFLILTGVAIFRLAIQKGRVQRPEDSVVLLGLAWFVIPAMVEALSSTRYNVLRHFLFSFPGFCLLVGYGADKLAHRYSTALLTLPFLYVFVQMVRLHPYQGAYLNEAVNAVIKKDSQNYFSLEYFGHPYKEGGEWLNAHREAGSEVFVPIFVHCANATLIQNASSGSLERFRDQSRPRYLMYITRISRYNDLIRYAEENLQPVYEIKRQKAVLLRIYRNSPL